MASNPEFSTSFTPDLATITVTRNGEDVEIAAYWQDPPNGDPYLVIDVDAAEGTDIAITINGGDVWRDTVPE